jgi:hypothetical protein
MNELVSDKSELFPDLPGVRIPGNDTAHQLTNKDINYLTDLNLFPLIVSN